MITNKFAIKYVQGNGFGFLMSIFKWLMNLA